MYEVGVWENCNKKLGFKLRCGNGKGKRMYPHFSRRLCGLGDRGNALLNKGGPFELDGLFDGESLKNCSFMLSLDHMKREKWVNC
ncbi:hypothetical protein CK203_049559 [Vitis vinifera]|uniref:Uncharacterized protein n=1 Tax=Vitis vinifera TaxID=29760 RepID=A0A438FZD0_VITVI|nr:hypothetical protein CK203_049559 [Vitis vinifera]